MSGTSSEDWFWQMRRRRMVDAPKTRADVEALVGRTLPGFADMVNRHLRPSVRFLEQSATYSGRPPLRLGGGAALGSTVAWPHVGTRPLHVVAVADLSQIAAFDETGSLPSTGQLHFLFDGLAGAFDLADPATAKVIYTDIDAGLNFPSLSDVSPRRLQLCGSPGVRRVGLRRTMDAVDDPLKR